MIVKDSPQLIASFLNISQTLNNLYEVKFKGRKLFEELINSFFERGLLIKANKTDLNES